MVLSSHYAPLLNIPPGSAESSILDVNVKLCAEENDAVSVVSVSVGFCEGSDLGLNVIAA